MRSDSDEEKTARLLARPKYEEDMQPSGPAPRHVEKPSLSPVQEEATPTPEIDAMGLPRNVENWTKAVKYVADHFNVKDLRDAVAVDYTLRASEALPALLEARAREIATEEAALSHDKNHVTRKEKAWQTIRDAATTLGNSDLLGAVHVYAATHHFASRVRIEHDLAAMYEKQLRGSISERETLTAQLEEIRVLYESRRMSVNAVVDEAQAAVARLTTERDKFQDWFQNAEQARAVAESRREQAIHDIEALPTFRVGKAGGLPEAVSRSAVLLILQGST